MALFNVKGVVHMCEHTNNGQPSLQLWGAFQPLFAHCLGDCTFSIQFGLSAFIGCFLSLKKLPAAGSCFQHASCNEPTVDYLPGIILTRV